MSVIDVKEKNYCPTLEEIDQYIKNSVFTQFCTEMKDALYCDLMRLIKIRRNR